MFIIMAVATEYRLVGQLAGLAVGATVWVNVILGTPLSGASLNPARSLGPALFAGNWEHFSAYIIGPIFGAIVGAILYRFVHCDCDAQDTQKCDAR